MKFIGYNNCVNAEKIFSDCPSYKDFLTSKKVNEKCNNKYKDIIIFNKGSNGMNISES